LVCGVFKIIINSTYRRDIQGLRGLSVLAVLIFHVDKTYLPNGYLGVDVFFVISGFVITPLILRIFTGNSIFTGLLYFYKSRTYRLAPALLATLFFFTLINFLFGNPESHLIFSIQGIFTLFLVGNLGAYMYTGDYFSQSNNYLLHTWSLSVEAQIYIFLPIFILVIVLFEKNTDKIHFLYVAITIASFTTFLFPSILNHFYTLIGIQNKDLFAFYSPISRLWQFTIGGLGYFVVYKTNQKIYKLSKNLNLALCLMMIFVFYSTKISMENRTILATFFALTFLIFNSFDELPIFIAKKLQWLGDRSYSIYLVHLPIIYLYEYQSLLVFSNSGGGVAVKILAIFTSIILGSLSYSKIEVRFRGKSKSNLSALKTIKYTLLTFLIPLVFLIMMYTGVKQQYFSLDKNVYLPRSSAHENDLKCMRLSESGPPCTYSQIGATKTILLIGDSHAGMISQAVVDASLNQNYNAVIWTHGGCPIQFENTGGELLSDICLENNAKMLRWVSENKPFFIVVSQFLGGRNVSNSKVINPLIKLKSLTPHILFIGNNPVFPLKVSRPILFSSPNISKEVDIFNMQNEYMQISDDILELARNETITTMDIKHLFCNSQRCFRFMDGSWLYTDSNHLSIKGAALIIPELEYIIKQLEK
jgi:peptidoglycan/LPS O-acetylase OafA/YrhL